MPAYEARGLALCGLSEVAIENDRPDNQGHGCATQGQGGAVHVLVHSPIKAAQNGAWIYANTYQTPITVRQDYTLEFVLVSNELEIGFKAVDATGNWLAVDHFRLLYISDDANEVTSELAAFISKAEVLAAEKTNAAAHDALQTAIDAAKTQLLSFNAQQSTIEDLGEAARALEAAYKTAEASKDVFARLNAAITDADGLLSSLSGGTADERTLFENAVQQSKTTYDSATTTDALAEAAITALSEAGFAFRVANGTGPTP